MITVLLYNRYILDHKVVTDVLGLVIIWMVFYYVFCPVKYCLVFITIFHALNAIYPTFLIQSFNFIPSEISIKVDNQQ